MRYTFDYTVQPDGTAALARVYGEEPVLVLPETLPGPVSRNFVVCLRPNLFLGTLPPAALSELVSRNFAVSRPARIRLCCQPHHRSFWFASALLRKIPAGAGILE